MEEAILFENGQGLEGFTVINLGRQELDQVIQDLESAGYVIVDIQNRWPVIQTQEDIWSNIGNGSIWIR